LAERLDVPFRVFSVAELEKQTANLANPSDVVFAEIGTYGVAEAAALEAAMLQTGGAQPSLFTEKQKTKKRNFGIGENGRPTC
jgi:cobalt-precorrin 5A hydrolase/precorrin-3B C17-methyltransferase